MHRGGTGRGAAHPCRRRLGRVGDDLPGIPRLWAGIEGADSVVFNPHKWLGAQFDCSVQLLRDPGAQVRTLGLRPTYLETAGREEIVNFNEWTVPLGRRFRALKLWFVLRAYGLDGLRARIRNARKEIAGAHPPRAQRELFRVVRELVDGGTEAP